MFIPLLLLSPSFSDLTFPLCWLQKAFRIFYGLSLQVAKKLMRTTPGFDKIMDKVEADAEARIERRLQRREEQKKAEDMLHLYGSTEEDDDNGDDSKSKGSS